MPQLTNSLRARLTLGCFVLYYSVYSTLKRNNTLPTVIEIDGEDIQYRSTLSDEQFPVDDAAADRSQWYENPVVGVVGGPWDKFKERWGETVFYESFEKRYLDEQSWERTGYYHWNLERGMSRSELDDRCEDIDRLFRSMEERGYVPQSAFLAGADNDMSSPGRTVRRIRGETFPDEPRVGIGRGGEIIRLGGGHHRLSFAKLLDLGNIPVIVGVRHNRWQSIRMTYDRAELLDDVPEQFRQYAGHPDLRDCSTVPGGLE